MSNSHHNPFHFGQPSHQQQQQHPQLHTRPSYGEPVLAHPPSRLSPPPGTDLGHLLTHNVGQDSARRDSMEAATSKRKEETGPKRGYRACVHCRLRKAKCDLGDVNSPSEPPCSRCRREQRSCVFLPSKRRKKNQPDDGDSAAEIYPAQPSGVSMTSIPKDDWHPPSGPNFALPLPPQQMPVSAGLSATLAPPSWPESMFQNQPQAGPSNSHPAAYLDQTLPADPPSIAQSNPTPTSLPESTGSGSALSPNQRSKRRRQHSPDATRRIVAANFSNETDALEILAHAAAENDSDDAEAKPAADEGKKNVRWDVQEEAKPRGVAEFSLVKAGVLSVTDVENLVRLFFECHHPVLPIFQTSRIPKTLAQLSQLAWTDPFLLSTMILVASRHHPQPHMKPVHEKTWKIVREALADYSFSGLTATVGFVEGVLLLAEFLPREQSGHLMSTQLLGGAGGDATQEGMENRRSWALTGLAIRAAYGIGLDQIALEVGGERTAEVERARSCWTWCYLYDRTIGLRTGLAFWSRGPTLCFLGYSHISQTGEAAARENFPYMLSPGGPGEPSTSDDSASLMQALMELTQIMTNAHDILYPSKGRTSALVSQGTYFKYCDHFRKALDTYALVWTDKRWKNPALKELASCTYQFVRLYVSSFAFQAHVQRAQLRAEEERTSDGRGSASGTQLFPRGSATSPDALYIYDSIDAANEILHICLRLGQMGVLQNLPSRYLINFVYGGVFALKAGYSGATSKKDMLKTKEVVDHVCATLVLSSPDRDHPASRYGGMLRMLAKKLEQLSDASAVPSRFPSPEPDLPTSNKEQPFNFAMNDQNHLPDLNLADFNLPHAVNSQGQEGLFDFDVEGVNFNLEGFWDDFSLLGEQSGFPFK